MPEEHAHEFMSLDGLIDAPASTVRAGPPPADGTGHRRNHAMLPGHHARAYDLRDVRAGLAGTGRGGRSSHRLNGKADQRRNA